MSRVKSVLYAMVLGLTACVAMDPYGVKFQGTPFFEAPPSNILFSDKEIFNQALSLQYKGQLKSSINLWTKFLAEHPKSFEALNNLGMAYYSDDQLDQAIQSFENALGIEPSSGRIKKNLRRTLRFRVTLNKENRAYLPAIKDLEKISNLVSENINESILRETEDLQEKIFSEVERLNTVEDYKNFLATYPNGFYADKARKKLDTLTAQIGVHPKNPTEFLPSLTPKIPKKEQPIVTDRAFKKQHTIEPTNKKIASSLSDEPVIKKPLASPSLKTPTEPEQLTAIESNLSDESVIKKSLASPSLSFEMKPSLKENPSFPKIQVEPKRTAKLKIRKIQVITKSSVLNIRDKPSLNSHIIGKLKKSSTVRVIDETSKWYRVVYSFRKYGWVSKRFAKEIE